MAANPKTLMMRPITAINIQQRGVDNNGNTRNLALDFEFCHEFEGESTWVNLTNKAKVIVPKNIYVIDAATQQPIALGGTQTGNGTDPSQSRLLNDLFHKGDAVSISYGYYLYDTSGNEYEVEMGSPVFTGYISSVGSKIPITLECEDNMWLCKQIPCANQVWKKTDTLEKLMNEVLKNYIAGPNYIQGNPIFTINALTETYVGDLQIQNMSVAQLLEHLRKHFHIEAYFKGNELFIGSLVYVQDTSGNPVNCFTFQRNIISDELTYQRKDDVKLSAVCESLNTVFQKDGSGNIKTNKQGQQKTKQDRLTVLVYWDPVSDPNITPWTFITKKKDIDFPENVEGERRKLFFPNITDAQTLANKGAEELQKYYYDGFKGNFTTFATPRVNQGDVIYLEDTVLPDRNGYYVVKGVKYTGGVNGHRQIITLDYKQVVVGNKFQITPGPVAQ